MFYEVVWVNKEGEPYTEILTLEETHRRLEFLENHAIEGYELICITRYED